MKPVEQQLYEYIDAWDPFEHTTETGIIISIPDEDYYLKADFKWAETKEGCIYVIFNSPMKEFVETLGIINVNDIDNLDPGKLTKLYHEGSAELLCEALYDNCIYFMEFKKQGNVIEASNEQGVKHTVPVSEKMDNPEELIAYAKQYYVKLFDLNNNPFDDDDE